MEKLLGVDKNGKWVNITEITLEENQLGRYAVRVQHRKLDGKFVTTYQIVEFWSNPDLYATNIDYACGDADKIKKCEDEFNQKLKNMGFPPYIGSKK